MLGLPEGDTSGHLGTSTKRQRGGGVIVLAAVTVLFARDSRFNVEHNIRYS